MKWCIYQVSVAMDNKGGLCDHGMSGATLLLHNGDWCNKGTVVVMFMGI